MYYNRRKDPRLSSDSFTIGSDTRLNAKIEEKAASDRERQYRLLEAADQQRIRNGKYSTFVTESKNYLLGESIYKLVKGVLTESTDSILLNAAKNICHEFVSEEGAQNLLRRFSTQSVFLSEIASIVEESHKGIIESAKEQINDDFTIHNSDLENFYSKLDQLDYDNMANAIRIKVSKAEEDFVQANINDRLDMEEIANKTKEKIDQIKAKSVDVENEIKQEFTQMYNESVSNIRNRKKSILESIVYHVTESIMTDDKLREKYTLENGKFNTKGAIELSEVMYTFLESVNTAQIKDITPEFLEKHISEI